jgi:hypothetical protein
MDLPSSGKKWGDTYCVRSGRPINRSLLWLAKGSSSGNEPLYFIIGKECFDQLSEYYLIKDSAP